jgi:hypothetical protein
LTSLLSVCSSCNWNFIGLQGRKLLAIRTNEEQALDSCPGGRLNPNVGASERAKLWAGQLKCCSTYTYSFGPSVVIVRPGWENRPANRVQLTRDGHRAYLETVEEAFGSDLDYAMLVKLYGADSEPDTRYSPAECILYSERVARLLGICRYQPVRGYVRLTEGELP